MQPHPPSCFDRRAILLGLMSYAYSSHAQAASKQAFSLADFRAALAGGGPVLVEVTASWCPTCRMQTHAVGVAINQPRFKAFKTFILDIDSQREAARALGVTVQSTLIVYKSGEEVSRSMGDAKRERIEALMALAL